MKRSLGAWVLIALAIAPSASAQVSRRRAELAPAARPPSLVGSSLRTRVGVDVAEALLKSADAEQRQRGLERLGSVGTPQALDLLLKAFENGGAARTARDRLVAVRALSRHAGVPAVRDFLVRVMVGVGSNPGRSEAIDGLIERAAALALARAGDDAALLALGKALRQSGHVAETASDALLAFPPRNLQPILEGLRAPSPALVSFLDALRDPRAIPTLREITRGGALEVRPLAAVALARLGVRETVELARHWLEHEASPGYRLAATRILLEFRSPDASAALSKLLMAPDTREEALALSGRVSLAELSPVLLKLSRGAAAEQQSALFSALAATGTREAFSFLGGALSTRDTASAAALALALSPASEAEATLARALAVDGTRGVAVRASIVRRIALRSTPSGVASAIDALARSRNETERALATQASAVFGGQPPAKGGAELRALARTALLPERAAGLCDRLALEQDATRREALGACLIALDAAERVPSDVLLDLIDARAVAAPLAARALAARDSRTLRPKITALLGNDDFLLRSHAALGLGHSNDGTALGLLESAYRFETEPEVRLAIVRALAVRHEPARLRALDLARRLDGAASVREAAVLALAGARPASVASGRQSAWLELLTADGTAPSLRSAMLISAAGLAVPVFADPDGVLLVPGLPTGPFELRLAAPTRTGDSSQQPP